MTADRREPMTAVIIGIGNFYRRDDAVGLVIARRLLGLNLGGVPILEHSGESAGLVEAWAGADLAILLDAVTSGVLPGTVHRIDATARALPAEVFKRSSHALGIPSAVELARTLGRLPKKLIIFGVEGREFQAGVGLSPEVACAAEAVVDRVCEEIAAASGTRRRGR